MLYSQYDLADITKQVEHAVNLLGRFINPLSHFLENGNKPLSYIEIKEIQNEHNKTLRKNDFNSMVEHAVLIPMQFGDKSETAEYKLSRDLYLFLEQFITKEYKIRPTADLGDWLQKLMGLNNRFTELTNLADTDNESTDKDEARSILANARSLVDDANEELTYSSGRLKERVDALDMSRTFTERNSIIKETTALSEQIEKQMCSIEDMLRASEPQMHPAFFESISTCASMIRRTSLRTNIASVCLKRDSIAENYKKSLRRNTARRRQIRFLLESPVSIYPTDSVANNLVLEAKVIASAPHTAGGLITRDDSENQLFHLLDRLHEKIRSANEHRIGMEQREQERQAALSVKAEGAFNAKIEKIAQHHIHSIFNQHAYGLLGKQPTMDEIKSLYEIWLSCDGKNPDGVNVRLPSVLAMVLNDTLSRCSSAAIKDTYSYKTRIKNDEGASVYKTVILDIQENQHGMKSARDAVCVFHTTPRLNAEYINECRRVKFGRIS